MFKKPLGTLKTSAPLRSSDRRKLKQRVVTAYGLTSEEGDILVPDGILSVKFNTHIDEPGVAYLNPDGDPLWFTVGKGSEELLPTVYTLWKKEDILPFLSTPSAVVPILIGGADLMIPGVIHCPPELHENQVVAIRQLVRKDGQPALSPPVAVGRMAIPSDQLRAAGQEKGKAVRITHTWKDHLWDMGSRSDIPPDTIGATSSSVKLEDDSDSDGDEEVTCPPPSQLQSPDPSEPSRAVSYSPTEVTEILDKALLQAIATSLQLLPPSSYPIPATQLYTNHILPCRPGFPTLVLPPPSLPDNDSGDAPQVEMDITIKTSSHKSLTTFLKAAEKLGLLTLKPPQKQQPDILVTAVNKSHPNVLSHTSFVTVKDLELKAAKKAAREEKERESQMNHEIEVRELWKPHQVTVDLFQGLGGSQEMYTHSDVQILLNSYITQHNLVNLREQAYINLDDLLHACVVPKPTKSKAKGKDVGAEQPDPMSRFMKRDELTKNVMAKMQSWHEVRVHGKEPVTKKGGISPIQVTTKVRQGRKASTFISGFEPFLVINADEMAEDLRKVCAGSTSISPIPGKPAGSGVEVLVQGKQSVAVVGYLTGKGIPKKWIEAPRLSQKK